MKKVQREKIKSMLNYYEIDVGGKRSEKMTDEQRKLFIDKFNMIYDSEVVRDVIKRISDSIKNSSEQNNEEKDALNSEVEDFDLFDENLFSEESKSPDANKNPTTSADDLQYLKEVNTFLGWLYGVLIQSRYSVLISNEGNITNIQLINTKPGGKTK
jgi:hypothetical protein